MAAYQHGDEIRAIGEQRFHAAFGTRQSEPVAGETVSQISRDLNVEPRSHSVTISQLVPLEQGLRAGEIGYLP
jgi:hypothetical protein